MTNFKQLSIPEVLLIEPQIFNDERGFFFESFNQGEFENAINRKVTFVQDNHSKSCYGVLRGLHYQKRPFAQGKLVRVVFGEVFDVSVDLRKDSPSYGQWLGVSLSAQNKKQLWIPEGFAHGFLVTSKEAELCYKTTSFYNPEYEECIIYNDKDLNITWPRLDCNFLLNNKDLRAKKFIESEF
jgi:dTDP-4-dehydrorhamnose 3,5-epimerase